MRLESALYSSMSGINAHGQAISVVGDNIANVSTTGFKTSRPEFSDIYAEGSDGRESTAGPFTGDGVQVGEVRQLHETGVIESTGRDLDAGIAGKGFFVVGSPEAPEYTRAGEFSISQDGLLVSTDGKPVLGYTDTGTSLSTLNMYSVKTTGTPTTSLSLFGNVTSDAAIGTPPANPASFKELNAAASYVTNTTVYDSLGTSHTVALAFFKTGVNKWTAQGYMDGGEVGGTAGVPKKVTQDLNLTFNSSGSIDDANKAAAFLTGAPAYTGGAAAGNFKIDLSSFNQFAAPSQLTSIVQDGKGAGQIKNYQISDDGSVNAVLDNGDTAKVGTIVLANFLNENGLDRSGNTGYVESATTGTRTLDKPGEGVSGKLQGSALERSTVDISSQFTDLILYQRGYEANSQSLNATNELLKNTIQLIR